MDLSAIAAFTGVAMLLTITPGADMALVTRAALASGRGEAFAVTLGIVSGLMVWATASALGVAALLATSATAFTVQGRRRGLPGRPRPLHAASRGRARAPRGAGARSLGLHRRASHQPAEPEDRRLLLQLLPQFIGPGNPVLATSLVMAGVHGALGVVWLSGYAWAVTAMGDVLRRPRVRTALDRVTGVVLVGLGAGLLLERRA